MSFEPSQQTSEEKRIKVAIVSTEFKGGAGIAADRLAHALRRHTPEIEAYPVTQPADLLGNLSPVRSRFESTTIPQFLAQFRTKVSNTYFSWPLLGIEPTSASETFDLINLHWVDGIIGLSSLVEFARQKRPVVWTLHDMAQLTGGCHYSAGCEKFVSQCEACPQLSEEIYRLFRSDPVRRFFDLKREVISRLPNLKLITPSTWLREAAKRSASLSNIETTVVFNSLDLDLFKPPTTCHRTKWDIPGDDFVILVGAVHLDEIRKNFAFIQPIVEGLESRFQDAPRQITILTFGSQPLEVPNLNRVRIMHLGRIESPSEISSAYGASDVLLHLAREDNLPNIVAEGMACGLPVIAFAIGGLPEMVDHSNGFLHAMDDQDGILTSLEHLIKSPDLLKRLSQGSRARAKSLFAPSRQAQAYSEVFQTAVQQAKNSPAIQLDGIRAELAKAQEELLYIVMDHQAANAEWHLQKMKEANESQALHLRAIESQLTEAQATLKQHREMGLIRWFLTRGKR